MQDGALQESNPSVLHQSIRNLRSAWPTGKLWLIDNESGLIDAYTLLYGKDSINEGAQFRRFHQQMLRTSCIFRRRTVERVRWLAAQPDPVIVLENLVSSSEPLYNLLSRTTNSELFRDFFHVRLKETADWLNYCESL